MSAASSDTTKPRAVLVGAPGSGKTSVGKLLAGNWKVGFRDTDVDIEESVGLSISDIFVQRGEDEFRRLEKDAVATALAEHRGVLALGGGAVMDADTRHLLKGHTVVHLQVGLAAAMKRLQMNRSRPLLVGNVRAQWQRLSDERQPLYAEVATITVDTDQRTPKDVAEAIESALEGAGQP